MSQANKLENKKVCTTCKIEKTLSSFPIRKDSPRGPRLRGNCFSCHNMASKEYKLGKEKECPEVMKQRRKLSKWKCRYNLGENDYNLLLSLQNNACAICKKSIELLSDIKGRNTKLSVDHCHVTGKIRGLLCHNCNVGIGNFADRTDVLASAIAYLNKQQ